jgi:hypothetical protein
MTKELQRLASPEWMVAGRADVGVEDSLQEGWGVSPAPLARGLAFTDFGTHQMSLPEGDTEEAKAVRLHEMIHARISPTQVPRAFLDQLGVSANSIRIAEEIRVNYLARILSLQGLDSSIGDVFNLADGSEKALADKCLERDSWNDALSLYMTTYNTKANSVVKRRLNKNPVWKENFAHIDKEMKHRLWKIDKRTFFEKQVRTIRNTHPNSFQWVEKKELQQAFIPSGFVQHSIPLATLIDQWIANPPVKEEANLEEAKAKRRSTHRTTPWEELRFGITSLTDNTGSFIGKRKRPSMTGKYPSRPDRLLTDPERRIFREVVKGKGGVVVFDCSGSMGVTHKVVRDTVKQFAGALVVVYSHNQHMGATSPNAWVVAKNGRMISEEDFSELPLHSGNGVDGPILRWAIRQRTNNKDFILWVSDGCVTGRGDDMTDNLVRECANLSMKHGIIGVDDCEAAIELLSDMKRTGSFPRNRYCRVIGRWVEALKKGNI